MQFHLQELLCRSVYICLGFTFSALFIFYSVDPFLFLATEPVLRASCLFGEESTGLVLFRLTEGFFVQIYVILFYALFAVWPLIGIHSFLFFASGFFLFEQQFFSLSFFLSFFLFVLSIFLANTFFLPRMLSFFLSFGVLDAACSPAFWPALSFSFDIYLAFILSSQLPIAVVLGAFFGWVNLSGLNKSRPWIILFFLLWASLVSPPDLGSQLILFLPLLIIYEVSFFLFFFFMHFYFLSHEFEIL